MSELAVFLKERERKKKENKQICGFFRIRILRGNIATVGRGPSF
jgi:hypothetical protein